MHDVQSSLTEEQRKLLEATSFNYLNKIGTIRNTLATLALQMREEGNLDNEVVGWFREGISVLKSRIDGNISLISRSPLVAQPDVAVILDIHELIKEQVDKLDAALDDDIIEIVKNFETGSEKDLKSIFDELVIQGRRMKGVELFEIYYRETEFGMHGNEGNQRLTNGNYH